MKKTTGNKGKDRNITIYDLAKELNVSPSTVSRALKDHSGIGKETKMAVKSLAKKRGYRFNSIASSLRTKHSNVIGVLVSNISRPFISSLISGIETGAREHGYHVIIAQSHDKYELEENSISNFFNSRIAGLIVSLAMETEEYQHFGLFFEHHIPVVFVDRIPNLNNVEKVEINNFKAAFEATEHLIEQGCRRIAHFGGSKHQVIYRERLDGYLAALKRNNFEIDESIIMTDSTLSFEEGTRLAGRVLSLPHPPDGIFCANDTAAVSAIRYAKKRNIDIPGELAIIGFNNDPVCEIIEPALSTVFHPAREMGRVAAKQIASLIDPSECERIEKTTFDTHVIVRASSDRSVKKQEGER